MKKFCFPILILFLFSNCKKKEVKQLIKSIEGDYIVYKRDDSYGGGTNITYTYDTITCELKKSRKGFKFNNIHPEYHFILNDSDSSFVLDTKNDSPWGGSGKIHSDESISFYINYSYKVPNGTSYEMFKK